MPRGTNNVHVENRTRLILFADMCGLFDSTADSRSDGWRPKKVNFFHYFLQSAVGRDVPAATKMGERKSSGLNSSNGSTSTSLFMEAIKERLSKRRTLVRLSHVNGALSRCVVDSGMRQQLVERANSMAFDGPDKKARSTDRLVLDLDSFLEVLMAAWEAHQGALGERRSAKLETLVCQIPGVSHDEDGIWIGYEAFEQAVREIRQMGGAETHEEHLEMLMDMFDEALRETELLEGEESDVVSFHACINIMQRTTLHEHLEPSAFVDPLNMSLEERLQQMGALLNVEDSVNPIEEHSGSNTATPSSRRRRLSKEKKTAAALTSAMKKRSSIQSKAPYVFEVIKSSVSKNFLFRHLDDAHLQKLVERMREVKQRRPPIDLKKYPWS